MGKQVIFLLYKLVLTRDGNSSRRDKQVHWKNLLPYCWVHGFFDYMARCLFNEPYTYISNPESLCVTIWFHRGLGPRCSLDLLANDVTLHF